MNYYVTLTTKCDQQCSYCYGKACQDFGSDFHDLKIDYQVPSSVTYRTETLQKFLGRDQDVHLVFYGGEPTLAIGKMIEFMDAVPSATFVVQTNGLRLDRIPANYLNRFESIFVSLDGDESITDHYRGRGTYRKVMNNLQQIRGRGFKGEIVARMTVGEETNIDDQVLALIKQRDLISSVHWQLDALFWQNDFPRRRFREWVRESYNPRIRKLIGIWVDHMQTGEVLKLYPFVGVMESLLDDKPTRLRCGAGQRMFNIQTDGNITPCPVMAGMIDFYLGNIHDSSPTDLRDAVSVTGPCETCRIFRICGGRCLYANVTMLWGEEGFRQVCETVHNMIEGLREAAPAVLALISNGTISETDFHLRKYNGCEVIP